MRAPLRRTLCSKKVLAIAAGGALTGGAVLFALGQALASGIPAANALTYSGFLEDGTGAPVTGDKAIAIQVYDAAAAGNKVCETPPGTVAVNSGRFSVPLPDTCTDQVKAKPDLWVDVVVAGVSLGRTKLGAVPYAVEAGHAVSATTADTANAAGGTLKSAVDAINTTLGQPQTYVYEGSLATPTEWEADLIYNKNFGRFCTAIGKQFVSATELVNHFNSGQQNGFFYQDWYYVGPQHCAGDTFYAGTNDPASAYSVWQYKGGCGCCQQSTNWTVETRALIQCQ